MIRNNGNNNNNNVAGDLLNVISIMLGYENLMENRQQSAENDVARHNRKQSDQLLADLHEQFDKQNEMLEYQNGLLEQILEILKGEIKNGL
jgi:hypothetical protein